MIATVDFETLPIQDLVPHMAPRPVSVAVKIDGKRTVYYAWGHAAGNDGFPGLEEATRCLQDVWKNADRLIFHNAVFDLAVAERHFGLPWPSADRIEDTKIAGFLADPNAKRNALSLKPMGERFLGVPATQRDRLKEWIVEHVIPYEPHATPKDWGAFIYVAPAKLVAPYCKQDVDLTYRLWQHFESVRIRMPEAYRRECAVLEVANRMTAKGFKVAPTKVSRAIDVGCQDLDILSDWIQERIGEVDLDKNDALIEHLIAYALDITGEPEIEWPTTPTGKLSTSHRKLSELIPGDPVFNALHHRNALATVIRTFLENWKLRLACSGDGRVHAQWNTVPGHDKGMQRGFGARTGRLSSTPNVQNIPKEANTEEVAGVIIPNLRELVRCEVKHRLNVRDYAAQEPRMMAHGAGGSMAQRYIDNPALDPHTDAAKLMTAHSGHEYTRFQGKQTGLSVSYALGAAELAKRLDMSLADARAAKRQYMAAHPELAQMDRELKREWALGRPIRTWGGREYYVEPPLTDDDGEVIRSWEYKAVNTWTQGSCADQLKQAMIDYYHHPDRAGELILCAHDELVSEVETKDAKHDAQVLAKVMEGVGPFRVPFITDGGLGGTWSAAK